MNNHNHPVPSRGWRALTRPSARYSILALAVVGFVIGVVAVIATQVMVHATGTNEFCVSCHEMDTAMKEYKETAHASNRFGVTAGCGDCHIPHTYPQKLVHKAIAGAKDVYGHLTGVIDTPQKYAARCAAMAQTVRAHMKANDSAECRHCHKQDRMALDQQKKSTAKKHQEAIASGDTCIECHDDVAHHACEEN
jgi:cytochrome c-type protein NapC